MNWCVSDGSDKPNVVSNLEANYTEYYCEQALTQKIGVAHHRLDLAGGQFVFTDGTTIYYGLGPY